MFPFRSGARQWPIKRAVSPRLPLGWPMPGVAAIEINLSCPNLEGDGMFALDAEVTGDVVSRVRAAVQIPIGAKLSPNAIDIASVACAAADAGADFVTLTNTIWGVGIDPVNRRPLLSGMVGGYSGAPLKPIALRCVVEVRRARPELPIVGCGGVRTAADVVEYLLAGAQAVAVGTAHFADPAAGRGIVKGLHRFGRRHGAAAVAELVGAVRPW